MSHGGNEDNQSVDYFHVETGKFIFHVSCENAKMMIFMPHIDAYHGIY